MKISLKVGSVMHFPQPSGVNVSASDPTVLAIAIASGMITVTALKVGQCYLAIQAGTDFAGTLLVGVAAA